MVNKSSKVQLTNLDKDKIYNLKYDVYFIKSISLIYIYIIFT
jgi:hypothetical protein